MCGILGTVLKEKQSDFLPLFQSSLNKLHSRWPDSEDIFHEDNIYLGHTRLSIIDTSSSANQPFAIGDCVIIFNGEIYNFHEVKVELMKAGYVFKTTSDTEVLLTSYIHWGEECVNHLDGMWAFCIYDKKLNKLFLSRDRVGEKPLLYYKSNDKFLFWSEIQALIGLLDTEKIQPNYPALSNFDLYNFRHIPSPYTAFDGIFKLEPGYNLVYNLDDFSIQKYKYFQISFVVIETDPVEQFDILFKKSVAQTCFADVPVGIFLSGGIDSSLIASVMQNRDITTYSLGYDENDPEITRADAIAKHLGLKNKKLYFKEYLETVDLVEVIKNVVCKYGEPINLMQIIYADIILKEMKKDGIKVAVGGNGADELFYGYNGMNLLSRISDLKKKLDSFWIGKLIPNHKLKELLYRYSFSKNDCILSKYKKFLYSEYLWEYAKEIPSSDLIDVFSWIGLRMENEHSITIINDIVGSVNGMEVRTPFLNQDILDFSCNLSSSEKVISYTDKTYNKRILKKTLEKYLPKELIYNKKMGFWYGINSINLILKNPQIEHYILEVSREIKIYDHKNVKRLYEDYKKWEKVNTVRLLSVVLSSIWFEKFILNK